MGSTIRRGSGHRDVVHNVRSSVEFRSAVSQLAHQLGSNTSALFRQALIHYASVHPGVDDQLRRQLIEAGSKIRQVVPAPPADSYLPTTPKQEEG